MKSSRNSSGSSKPPVRGGPSREKEESDDDTSTAGTVTTETTLVDVNVKEYQVNNLHIENQNFGQITLYTRNFILSRFNSVI